MITFRREITVGNLIAMASVAGSLLFFFIRLDQRLSRIEVQQASYASALISHIHQSPKGPPLFLSPLEIFQPPSPLHKEGP